MLSRSATQNDFLFNQLSHSQKLLLGGRVAGLAMGREARNIFRDAHARPIALLPVYIQFFQY